MGATLKYGVRDGLLVSIDDDTLEPGLKCGCVCPDCGERLVAKNKDFEGRLQVFHFAHEAVEGCRRSGTRIYWNAARETALHKAAKKILLERKAVMIPGYKLFPGAWTSAFRGLFGPKLIEFDAVTEEETVKHLTHSAKIRPDIVGRKAGMPDIYIEFKVTHAVGEKKADRTQNDGRRMLEIDLNKIPGENVSAGEIARFLTASTSHREWVSHGPGSTRYDELLLASRPVGDGIVCPANIGPTGGPLCAKCPCRLSPIGHATGHFRCTGRSLVTNNEQLKLYIELARNDPEIDHSSLPYGAPAYIGWQQEFQSLTINRQRFRDLNFRLKMTIGPRGYAQGRIKELDAAMSAAWKRFVEEIRSNIMRGQTAVVAAAEKQIAARSQNHAKAIGRLNAELQPSSNQSRAIVFAAAAHKSLSERLAVFDTAFRCDCGSPLVKNALGYYACSNDPNHPLYGRGALTDRIQSHVLRLKESRRG